MVRGQPTRKYMVWDDSKVKRLQLIMLAVANLKFTEAQWAKVAELFGDDLSPSAASQKYSKIKGKNCDLFNAVKISTTPRKEKRAAVTPRTSPSKSGHKTLYPEDKDDDEDMATPVKTTKKDEKDEKIAPKFEDSCSYDDGFVGQPSLDAAYSFYCSEDGY